MSATKEMLQQDFPGKEADWIERLRTSDTGICPLI